MYKFYPTIYDIGGRGGLHRSWNKFPFKLRYFSFEPDKIEAKFLEKKFKNKKNFENKVFNFALDVKNKKNFFYIYSNKANSSLLKINKNIIKRNKNIKVKSTIKINSYSIDFLVKNQKLQRPDFLSIDTEGSELNILKGCKNNIKKIIGIRCESSFQDNYLNGSKFSEVYNYLSKKGFVLIRMETCNAGYCGFSTDMNKFSISPMDAVPNMADFIFYNKKMIEKLIKVKSKLNFEKLKYFIIWTVYNGSGYLGLEYLKKLNKDFFSHLNFDDSLKFEFYRVIISYLQIKRIGFNKRFNFKKELKKLVKDDHIINKIRLNNKLSKHIKNIYNHNLLLKRFLSPKKQYDTV